jgi:hypothetical protein
VIPDVAKGFFRALARSSVPRIDYFAFYRATVQAQSSDLATVDVQPDDARLPGMTGIGIRPGLPGTKVKIPNGVSVMIGFMGGSPRLPYVATWDSGSGVTEVQIGGTRKVARVDDHAPAGTMSFSAPATIAGTYTDPDGVVTAITVGTPIPLRAKINEGSDILKAG